MRHMVSHNFKHGALPTTDIVISTHQHSGTKSQTTLLWAAPPSRRTIKRRATARQLVLNPVITTVRFVQSVAYSSAIVQRQQEGQRFGRAKFECRYQYRHQTPPLQPPADHILRRFHRTTTSFTEADGRVAYAQLSHHNPTIHPIVGNSSAMVYRDNWTGNALVHNSVAGTNKSTTTNRSSVFTTLPEPAPAVRKVVSV
jgi:hypothetical protein